MAFMQERKLRPPSALPGRAFLPDKQKRPQESGCPALQPFPDDFLSSVLGTFFCVPQVMTRAA